MSAPHDIASLEVRLAPARAALVDHPVYAAVTDPAALRVFAEHHVFAVWDFMCLLKELQRRLTCVAVPWVPGPDATTARLINEIVLGEESDELPGGAASHYQLYRDAMADFGASTQAIDCFMMLVRGGSPVATALAEAGAPAASRAFVEATFEVLEGGSLAAVTAAFTYGREDVIPDMFRRLVDELAAGAPGEWGRLRLYLERHIEVDGESHGPLSRRMLEQVCAREPGGWEAAEAGARQALVARKALWDGVFEALPGKAQARG